LNFNGYPSEAHRAAVEEQKELPAEGPACNEVDLLIPVNRHEAQHAPVMRPSFTFGCIIWPGFEFSLCACAGLRAIAVEDEGFGLSGVLVMLSTLPYSSQILAT
jgi:hypothetical protein